jgi:hypothetical protein
MPLNVDRISTGSLSVNGTEINKNGDGYGMDTDGQDQVLLMSFVDSNFSNNVLNSSPIEIRVYN